MLYAVIVRIGWSKIKIFEKLRTTLPKSDNEIVRARASEEIVKHCFARGTSAERNY